MGNRVSGTVYKVFEKTFSGKVNYSIKLEDNPIYYRANQKRFAGIAEPGNVVQFDAEMNEDGKSARITSDVTLVPRNAASAPASTPSVGGRETSIHYQSARKDALQFVQIAVESGALPLPTAATKKLGVLEAAVDRYTAQFYEDIGTLGAVVRAAGDVDETESGGAESEADSE